MQTIERFLAGFRRFQENYFGQESELFDELKHGQSPSTLIIGCSDSRVDPVMLTGCEPGELFVVRNVANLVPPCEDQENNTHHSVSAALEFAVLSLKVQRIIVLGHACCGGIQKLMESQNTKPAGYLDKWLSIAAPVREHVLEHYQGCDAASQLAIAERSSILVSLDNLMTYPWLKERVEAGKLSLHGWYFDIRDGALHGYDLATRQFMPLVCPLERRQAG